MVTGEQIGRAVVIRAADDWYRFVDGWAGILARFESGMGVVEVEHEGITKTFLVPPDQIEPQGEV